MSDLPDYQIPISIQAVTLASLPIDIVAQTIGNIAINIASSAITLDVKTPAGQHVDTDVVSSIQLNVNVAASAITLNVHETGTANVAIASSVQLNVNLAASAITLNVHEAGTANVAIASSVTLNIAISSSAINVPITTAAGQHVDVDITSSVTINVAIQSSAVTLNVAIQSSAVTLNVNIASSAVTLNVAIQSSAVTLNVAIQSSAVTLNVAIQSQAVDLNIKTSGGVNIIIDQLTQTAYTQRVIDVYNHGASASWTTTTGNNRVGKFFPRGCRGHLSRIWVYCRDSGVAGGTITIYLSPYPDAGYIYTANITVPAAGAADWRAVNFFKMWNYDSLFISLVCSSSSIEYGFDAGSPYDFWNSSDAGVTWTGSNYRGWFYASLGGATVGDIPVSGTLNTIELPNTLSLLDEFDEIDIDGGTTRDLLATIYGMGELTGLQGHFYETSGVVTYTDQRLGIVTDGITFELTMTEMGHSQNDALKTIAPVSIGDRVDADYHTAWAINVPIRFRRSLRIYARNTAGSGNRFRAKGIYIVQKAV